MDDGHQEHREDPAAPLSSSDHWDQDTGQDPDTVKVVGHALSLSGTQRREYLHEQAGSDTKRYEQFVRLVRMSEIHSKGSSAKAEGHASERLGSTKADSPTQLAAAWKHVRADLEALGPRRDALEPGTRIAEGGMGEIREAWDPLLRRTVAIKSLRREDFPDPSAYDQRHHGALLRFVEEARITGQLDHPGIVPVHALGLDKDGRMYFAMRRVRGQDLSAIFDSIRAGNSEWTTSRVLGVLQRVCEAMAYAHDKGVVHRDLKPANIMVGRFGEVHVLDWGVARIIGDEEARRRDLRDTGPITQTRIKQREGTDAILTQDGDVLGTPAYMSPEQAAGKLSDLGPHSDVYSMGAMLYHLLSGSAPYAEKKLGAGEILLRIAESAPQPLEGKAKHIPGELIAICNKAMARHPSERYRDMGEMALDLTAFLEERVVRAHKVGALIELRKWVHRNRLFASTLAALLLVIISATVLIAYTEKSRAREAQRSLDMEAIEHINSDFWTLGPIGPEGLEERDAWLAEARELIERAPIYRRELEDLRNRGMARADPLEGSPFLERVSLADLAFWIDERDDLIREKQTAQEHQGAQGREGKELEHELAFLEPHFVARTEEYAQQLAQMQGSYTHTFTDPKEQERHDRTVRFFLALDRLTRPDDGLIARANDEIERCRSLKEETTTGQSEAWDEAIEAIADRELCPAYDGLRILPIAGLVPLGLNFESGLFEFWHVLSGTEPSRDEEGQFKIDADFGLIFILVPGGPARLNVPDGKGLFDVKELELDAFFLSKFEMTQEQWTRLRGENPSSIVTGADLLRDGLFLPGHPVEMVSWSDAVATLPRWKLALPTGFQWAHAASGGPDAKTWLRNDFNTRSNINAALNVRYQASLAGMPPGMSSDPDGHDQHSRVGSFKPNPTGFFDILGNVGELCADWQIAKHKSISIRAGDGRLEPDGYKTLKTYRGSSFREFFSLMAIQQSIGIAPQATERHVGIRPVFDVRIP